VIRFIPDISFVLHIIGEMSVDGLTNHISPVDAKTLDDMLRSLYKQFPSIKTRPIAPPRNDEVIDLVRDVDDKEDLIRSQDCTVSYFRLVK